MTVQVQCRLVRSDGVILSDFTAATVEAAELAMRAVQDQLIGAMLDKYGFAMQFRDPTGETLATTEWFTVRTMTARQVRYMHRRIRWCHRYRAARRRFGTDRSP